MIERAQWGPSEEPPRPSEPRVGIGPLVVGALALLTGGLAFAAAVVSTLGMVVVGEPYEGRDLVYAGVFGGLGAVVLWIGWRAHRRGDPGARAGAAILGRLAPVLGGAGMLLGIAAGVWMTQVGLDAAISIDRGYCSNFSGPLAPRDAEACRTVARECRRKVSSGPAPTLPRGVDPGAEAPPQGVHVPPTAKARAIVTCMLDRRDEFVR